MKMSRALNQNEFNLQNSPWCHSHSETPYREVWSMEEYDKIKEHTFPSLELLKP